MSYLPNQPKKRPVYTASDDIMKRSTKGKFADMPFETMEVGQSFVVQESEGFKDKELRSRISTMNTKGQRKFRVKYYSEQGFWEVCRMPDTWKSTLGRKPRTTSEQKTTENGPNFVSPLPWGQQLGRDMDQG